VGEWIGIRAQVDHVVTFNRACPVNGNELCSMPCADHVYASEEQPIQFQKTPS
jgi:iron(III) transport system ATP-binding protein